MQAMVNASPNRVSVSMFYAPYYKNNNVTKIISKATIIVMINANKYIKNKAIFIAPYFISEILILSM